MFAKPYKSKAAVTLKNSEKKKLRTRLYNQSQKYDCPLSDAEEIGLSQSKTTQLASTKLHTITSEQVTCYFEDSEPVLLETKGGSLIPTVYLIWRCPSLIPKTKVFAVWPIVLTKLQGGADLMAPGVIMSGSLEHRNACLESMDKNDVIGLRVLNEKGGTAIVAICEVLMTNGEIMESRLRQGRFARVVNIIADSLWEAGSRKLPTEDDRVNCENVHKIGEIPTEKADEGENSENEESDSKNVENGVKSLGIEDKNPESSPETETVSVAKAMDDLLMHGLLHALKTTFREKTPPDFPILNSQFYTKFVQPNIPAFDNTSVSEAASTQSFELKKTSYKKLPNFLNYCEEIGLISTSKNPENNHVFIKAVDPKHKLVRQFKIEDEADNMPKVEAEFEKVHVPVEPGEAKEFPTLQVLYGVTGDCAKFLPGRKRGEVLNGKQIREGLEEYLKINDLLLSGGDCQPDPGLAHICKISDPVTQIKKINEKFFNKMTMHHVLDYCNRQKLFRGNNLPTIMIKVAKRGGNKKVTFVGGLENYFINPETLSKCLKKKLQAATVINEQTQEEASSMFSCKISGKKDEIFKTIQIQGGATGIISKCFLEDYKLGGRFITIEDKTAPKKKK